MTPSAPSHAPVAPAAGGAVPAAGQPASAARPASATAVAYEQEVRMAVVMYGGVSLAIYINGVAQELLRLVRATAPDVPGGHSPLLSDEQLDPAERIYRELACRLGRGFDPGNQPGSTLRTRFVVDVLSGTSAGGINAIFLACALARNGSLDRLKELWISEGDMSKLLNDEASVGDLKQRLKSPRSPRALLNSDRMYLKLLEALQGVVGPNGTATAQPSSLADELDLFVTATDLQGLLVKLRLADKLVYERRYRSVFHFLYATPYGTGSTRDDLHHGNNPFLAFAARCTSSFPVAFEPMTLEQAKSLLGPQAQSPAVQLAAEGWRRLYRAYQDPAGVPGREQDPSPGPFEKRPFGDGGYLDNKPFGHAIAALGHRRADAPVQRKLIYVEPSPEHPELDDPWVEPPDAVENLMLAASALPRRETIREDLERLLERNRQIEHFNRAARYVGIDFRLFEDDDALQVKGSWPTQWLNQIVNPDPTDKGPRYGGAYGGYHRLRVSAVTSELAEAIGRVIGLSPGSEEITAIRFLLSAWRQLYYQQDKEGAPPHAQPENAFLSKFDLAYRMRRLQFIQGRIEMLLTDNRHADDVLAVTEHCGGVWTGAAERPGEREQARMELRKIQRELAQVQVQLRAAGRRLRQPGPSNPAFALIETVGLSWDDVKLVLRTTGSAPRIRVARELLGVGPGGLGSAPVPPRVQALNAVTDHIAAELLAEFNASSRATHRVLDDRRQPPQARDLASRARRCLWHHYRRFDIFDMVLFPMVAGTDLGELREVQVLRVSPEDATRLFEERDPDVHKLRRSKLAGTRLGNFGAFLDPVWRRSDILWGRLDMAERIVDAVVPQPPAANQSGPGGCPPEVRESLLGRLQAAIIEQELVPLGPTEGRKVFVEAFLHPRDNMPDSQALNRALDRLGPYLVSPEAQGILEPGAVRETYQLRFAHHRSLDRERQVRLTARGTQVVGQMLETLSDRYSVIRKRWAWWIFTSGRLAAGLLEIAVPRSVWELVGRYWLNLLYVLELVIVAGGFLLKDLRPGLGMFGVALLGGTLAVDLGRRALRRYLRSGAWRGMAVAAVMAVVLLASLGVVKARELSARAVRWAEADPKRIWIAAGTALGLAAVVWLAGRIDRSMKRREAKRSQA